MACGCATAFGLRVLMCFYMHVCMRIMGLLVWNEGPWGGFKNPNKIAGK